MAKMKATRYWLAKDESSLFIEEIPSWEPYRSSYNMRHTARCYRSLHELAQQAMMHSLLQRLPSCDMSERSSETQMSFNSRKV
jgi:hypothetical protein